MQEAAENFDREQAAAQVIEDGAEGPSNRHTTGKQRRQEALERSYMPCPKPIMYGPRKPLREVRRELQEQQ